MLRPARRPPFSPCSIRPSSSSPQHSIDHYKVLGVAPTATAKEVKAAYYALSKKHHPDTNPTNKEEAVKKFTLVKESYEILSDDEARRVYDAKRGRTPVGTRRAPDGFSRDYTDLDIDYKHFEAFQKNARRRARRNEYTYEWPDEFSNGSRSFRRPREFRSVFDEATERMAAHKDSRTQQREMEELRREVEREQERLAQRYPMPTFEQMLREKRYKEAAEARRYTAGLLTAMTAGMLLFLIISR